MKDRVLIVAVVDIVEEVRAGERSPGGEKGNVENKRLAGAEVDEVAFEAHNRVVDGLGAKNGVKVDGRAGVAHYDVGRSWIVQDGKDLGFQGTRVNEAKERKQEGSHRGEGEGGREKCLKTSLL